MADETAARLAPVLTAVLTIDEYASLNHPADCPVCGSTSALTPERLVELRAQLGFTHAVDTAAGATTRIITDSRHALEGAVSEARAVVPPAASWRDEQLKVAAAQLEELGIDTSLAAAVRESAQQVATASGIVETAAATTLNRLDRATEAVSARQTLPKTDAVYADLDAAIKELAKCVSHHSTGFAELRAAVEPAVRERVTTSGLRDIEALLDRRDQLVNELAAESARRRTSSSAAGAGFCGTQ